jgi:hypothetical protein
LWLFVAAGRDSYLAGLVFRRLRRSRKRRATTISTPGTATSKYIGDAPEDESLLLDAADAGEGLARFGFLYC